MTAIEAQSKLVSGNQRFFSSQTLNHTFVPQQAVIVKQTPFAIILGCSDSRVPIETIFDQSFGDLFIIRVAGNIVAPSQLGSIEFAVSLYNTPLVVVLGHTYCGAVMATIEESIHKKSLSDSVNSITKRIKPVLEPLLDKQYSKSDLVCQVANANIKQSVAQLHSQSEIIATRVKQNKLTILGAKYSLKSGKVDFFSSLKSGF